MKDINKELGIAEPIMRNIIDHLYKRAEIVEGRLKKTYDMMADDDNDYLVDIAHEEREEIEFIKTLADTLRLDGDAQKKFKEAVAEIVHDSKYKITKQ